MEIVGGLNNVAVQRLKKTWGVTFFYFFENLQKLSIYRIVITGKIQGNVGRIKSCYG